jgi:hypothetical protein
MEPDRPTPPGWYDDPTGVAGRRWWDGERWTAQTSEAAPAADQPADDATTRRWPPAALAGGLAALVLVAGFTAFRLTSSDDGDDREADLAAEVEELREQVAAATTTTAAPPRTTAPRATTTTTTPPVTTTPPPAPTTVQIGGTVDVSWFVQTEIEGGSPSTCASIASSYEVQIADGAGSVLAVSALRDPQTIADSTDDLAHTLDCRFSYGSEVQRTPVYTVSALEGDTVVDTETQNGIVAAVDGVALHVSYACTLSDCG